MADDLPEEPDRRGGAPHPRHTCSLFGQEQAEAAFLGSAETGRLHHAWLISGPAGIGKATLAWRIARFLLTGGEGSSLDMDPGHPVFRQTSNLSAPGLYLCRRPWDAKTEKLRTAITVDEVRGLKSFFQVSAADGQWRVAIVDAVDELNGAAANSLLKILEEPPSRAVLLLVCHRPARMLPTIRSRCRELKCRPLATDPLLSALKMAGAEPDAQNSQILAELSGGSVGEAFDILSGGGIEIYDQVLSILATSPRLDRNGVRTLSGSCAARNAPGRFQMTLNMISLAMFRLARAGAGGRTQSLSSLEGDVMSRLGAEPAQAQVWASAAPEIRSRAETAKHLNLDPEQVIFDTFLQIEAAASDALSRAA